MRRTCGSRDCSLQTVPRFSHCLLKSSLSPHLSLRSVTRQLCPMSQSSSWATGLRAANVNNENQPRLLGKSAASSLSMVPKPRQALAQATNTLRQLNLKAGGVKKAEGDLKAEPKRRLTLQPRNRNIVVNDENAGVVTKPTIRKPQTSCGERKSLVVPAVKPVAHVDRLIGSLPEEEETEAEEIISFSHFLIPDDVENIDANDGSNVMLATDYVNDIYSYLRVLEKKQTIRSNFLAMQKEMTPKMRSVLVDWLVNVHHQFKLLPESLYMGVGIMDRFFQAETVSKDKIQLVGVTAFFIATKFEEIYPPDLSDFVAICDSLYSKRDILKMEMVILRVLKFEIGRPLPLHFLRRNSKAAHADPKIHTLAKYLMELTLLEHTCSHWAPSLLAATALYVTLKVLAPSPSAKVWTPTLTFFSKYSEQQLLPFAAEICKLISKAEKSRYQNIRKKYTSAKQYAISQLPELDGDYVKKMAAMSCD